MKTWLGDRWPQNADEARKLSIEQLRALDHRLFKPSADIRDLVHAELMRRALSGSLDKQTKVAVDWNAVRQWIAIGISIVAILVSAFKK